MSVRPRPPKIPLSPSSPPDTGLKRRRTSETFAKLPPSPPHMSVATKSYVAYGHTSHMDEAAPRSSPRSPSSASSYTRPSTQRNSQPYSTPNSSSSALPGLGMNDDSDQHRDKRQRREGEVKDEMDLDRSILSTNHDRLKKEEEDDKTGISGDVDMRDRRANEALEQLENDMGEPFLLCRSRVAPAKPDPQNHMLSIYGLGPLLRTVARTAPDTGEKINKLRKSYEGQIKGFQLSGRNKPVKHDTGKGPSLRESIGSGMWPAPLESDEDWNRDHATRKIRVDGDFKAKSRQAMQMQPGKVRDEQKWDDVLGHEKTRPAPIAATANLPSSMAQRPNGHLRPGPNTIDAKRTTRGKKRSYGDDSFVGYGDGYSDVDSSHDPDADEGSDDGSRKKRRKNDSFSGALLSR